MRNIEKLLNNVNGNIMIKNQIIITQIQKIDSKINCILRVKMYIFINELEFVIKFVICCLIILKIVDIVIFKTFTTSELSILY